MKAFASKLKRNKGDKGLPNGDSPTEELASPILPTTLDQQLYQQSMSQQQSMPHHYQSSLPHGVVIGSNYTHEKEIPRSMPLMAATKSHTVGAAGSVRSTTSPVLDGDRMQVESPNPQQRPGLQKSDSSTKSFNSRASTPSMPTSHTFAYTSQLPINKQTIEVGLTLSRGPPLVERETKGKYQLVDFQIQRTLGTGSFGRVHLVQSRHNSRFYAIKVLKKQQIVKMKQIEHTNDERAMLRKVKHPFLITLWGTFADSKNLYMVMDFIEGGELFSLLRKSQRFPNPVAKFYAAEVALALDFLHYNNIVYRDLKPENLLLDRHGHVKIADFGFAKEVPDITWTLCGTPDYLAPEVVASKGYNKSVDWWSLGILTFEMLAGHPPFYDANPMKLYENILAGVVRYPSYFDALAKDFLGKLLTADLTKRFGNLRNGSRDVMEHAWFGEVNWERLAKRDIEPPYCPPLKSAAGDAHLFDVYAEEQEAYGATGPDPYGHLFDF